jgi:hypothetical protein
MLRTARERNRRLCPYDTALRRPAPAHGDGGVTREVPAETPPAAPRGPLDAGCRVRIVCVRTRDRLSGRVGDLGRGQLLAALAMGKPMRFAIAAGATQVTTPVRGLCRLAPNAFQVTTANSVYRVELGS